MKAKLAVALVLVGLWFAMASCTGESEGGSSPEGVAAQATEAMEAGDLEQLLPLVAPQDRDILTKHGQGSMKLPGGELTDLEIDGDTATGKLGGKSVRFSRIDGTWYLRVPEG